MPRFIDSHCHLHFEPFASDRQEVLTRMTADETWAITVGTSTETSRSAVEFANGTPGVWAAIGHHPEHLTSSFRDPLEGEVGDFDADEIRRIATSSKKVVAIGETGLDFFRIDAGRDRAEAEAIQESAFRAHLAIADELDLPVTIHCRDALTRLARIVRDEQEKERRVRGVVHCFTGSWDEATPLLDLGLHISFTGIITFPAKKSADAERHVHRVIERMPMHRLLIETDAPWLAPVPHRGERNEPSYVRFVAEEVARIRHMSFDAVAEQTTANACRFFNIH